MFIKYRKVIVIKVVIDADGCPVVKTAARICRQNKIRLVMVYDTSHVFDVENAESIVVDKGSDSADFKIVNIIEKGDIVITQDYGLAAMCLARKAVVINQDGMQYDTYNIDSLLMSRHMAKKLRMSGKHLKGNPKRNDEQNRSFEIAFEKLIL